MAELTAVPVTQVAQTACVLFAVVILIRLLFHPSLGVACVLRSERTSRQSVPSLTSWPTRDSRTLQSHEGLESIDGLLEVKCRPMPYSKHSRSHSFLAHFIQDSPEMCGSEQKVRASVCQSDTARSSQREIA